jgi:hypothetical protein
MEAVAVAKMTAEQYANAVLGSEQFMWLMAGANHPEAHLADLRTMYAEWQRLGGVTWGKKKSDEAVIDPATVTSDDPSGCCCGVIPEGLRCWPCENEHHNDCTRQRPQSAT